MRRLPLLLMVMVWVMTGYAAPAKPAAKPVPGTTSMTAVFRDGLPESDRVKSDLTGAYVDGLQGVKAIIDGLGDFDLDTDTGGQGFRTLFVDLDNCASTSCSRPFSGGAHVDAYLSTGAGGLPAMAVNASKASKLQILFITPTAPDTQWFLRFDTASYPTTSTVTVTRTALNEWTIEAASGAAAKLFSATTRGKLVLTDRGNYYVPFKVTVTTKALK